MDGHNAFPGARGSWSGRGDESDVLAYNQRWEIKIIDMPDLMKALAT
jgi:hypothetical protein